VASVATAPTQLQSPSWPSASTREGNLKGCEVLSCVPSPRPHTRLFATRAQATPPFQHGVARYTRSPPTPARAWPPSGRERPLRWVVLRQARPDPPTAPGLAHKNHRIVFVPFTSLGKDRTPLWPSDRKPRHSQHGRSGAAPCSRAISGRPSLADCPSRKRLTGKSGRTVEQRFL
jgi:hypothetical protein